MRSDGRLYVIHYYLEKGYSLHELFNLSSLEFNILLASIMLTAEEVPKADGK